MHPREALPNPSLFLRRAQCQRQGVHATNLRRSEFIGQSGVHRTRSRHPGLPGKRRRDHQHAVMRLPPGLSTRMPGVMRAVVPNRQQQRRKNIRQDRLDTIGAG